MDNHTLIIDQSEPGILSLSLGTNTMRVPYEGPVDNLLLTAVDNLLRRSTLHKSALRSVTVGAGIDKNSSLYRIVQSFAAAVAVSGPTSR